MERVGILLNKLQEQFRHDANVEKMLVTVQMLYAELLLKADQKNDAVPSKISVVVPNNVPAYTTRPVIPAKEVKENSEPKEVKENSESKEKMVENPLPLINVTKPDPPVEKDVVAVQPPTPLEQAEKKEPSTWGFDPKEVPTLAQQEKGKAVYELNDTMVVAESSLNDKLKEEKHEVATFLRDVPIRDLKKAISINDRHRFVEQLFRGDETMYERSIKTINNFSIFAEAEFWIQRELKLKLGWDNDLPEVKLFDQLVKRRFSAI